MTKDDLAVLFTNRAAAGSVTFTLPPTPTTGDVLPTGWWCSVFNCVLAQNVVVSSDTASTITTFNNLTASTLTWSTTNERAGAGVTLIWDGTSWLTQIFAEETQSLSVT